MAMLTNIVAVVTEIVAMITDIVAMVTDIVAMVTELSIDVVFTYTQILLEKYKNVNTVSVLLMTKIVNKIKGSQ